MTVEREHLCKQCLPHFSRVAHSSQLHESVLYQYEVNRDIMELDRVSQWKATTISIGWHLG